MGSVEWDSARELPDASVSGSVEESAGARKKLVAAVKERGAADVAAQLAAELARVRARSATDPAIAGRSLAPAWIGGQVGLEDDEAEFIDTVADCVAAGLPLDTALECWRAGDLAYAPDDEQEEEEITQPGLSAAQSRRPPPDPLHPRHRYVVR